VGGGVAGCCAEEDGSAGGVGVDGRMGIRRGERREKEQILIRSLEGRREKRWNIKVPIFIYKVFKITLIKRS
jgi:hypothetical protein